MWPDGPLAPSSQELYEGALTRLTRLLGPTLDYYWVWTPEGWEWDKVNMSDPVVQNVVTDTLALQAARDAVAPNVKLATCGWVLGPLGNRSYFDSVLPLGWAMSSIDVDLGNDPVDPAYASLVRHADRWAIPWAEDDPGLTAPELWVNRTLLHAQEAQLYNCTGLPFIHWRTRDVAPQVAAGHAYAWNDDLVSTDFWDDWSTAQFGPSGTRLWHSGKR